MSSNPEPEKAALFERTMLPHLDAAYNLARWLTRNDDDAAEVVQEAYLRAFRYFDTFAGTDERVWLFAIVRNNCINLFRRRKSDPVLFDEQIHSPNAPLTLENEFQKQDILRALRDCIQLLPAGYRETIVMREFEELSYKQISDITALPLGTVMSRLSRSRKRLEECMTSKGHSL